MPCLKHSDPAGPAEHYMTPFEALTSVRCPCEGGCTGVLRSEGRNANNTLTVLACSVCRCAYEALDSEEAAKEPRTCREQLAEALGINLNDDTDWTWSKLLDVARSDSEQLARIRRVVG